MKKGLLLAGIAALGVAFGTARPQAAQQGNVTPPPVPGDIEVEVGNEPFLVGHGVGTQNYECSPVAGGVDWVLFTPQATLFTDEGHQIITHFFSPNPEEDRIVRVTWQHSRDSSTVWGFVKKPSTDPNFVAPGAVAWLLVQISGRQSGPTGGDTLTGTTFIQRVNTVGGLAPKTGCSVTGDLGRKAFVPYTADYFFYKKIEGLAGVQ
jgi:hypothetical protein